jgi:hypothetical protein
MNKVIVIIIIIITIIIIIIIIKYNPSFLTCFHGTTFLMTQAWFDAKTSPWSS